MSNRLNQAYARAYNNARRAKALNTLNADKMFCKCIRYN